MAKKRARPEDICFLCGREIGSAPSTRGHVISKQFLPEQLRQAENIELPWCWAHTSCDGSYKNDEEYFYVGLYPSVANSNADFATVIFDDIGRRAEKPQVRNLLARILKGSQSTTRGGIQLPPGIRALYLDEARLQRVAIKTAMGLLFRVERRHFSVESCLDIRLCEDPSEVPEMYTLAAQCCKPTVVQPKVFTYWHLHLPEEGRHIVLMLFWEAILFGLVFSDAPTSRPDGI